MLILYNNYHICNRHSRFFYNFLKFIIFNLQATLAILDKLDIDSDKPNEEEIARLFGYEDDYLSGRLSWWQKLKPRIWSIFEEPHSSLTANVSTYKLYFMNLLRMLHLFNGIFSLVTSCILLC